MELAGGAWRRSKLNRRRLARAGAVLLAVAAAQAVLIGTLDLTGPAVRATGPAVQAVPYYLTAERTPPPAPHTRAVEQHLPKKRRPAAASPAAPPPSPSVSSPSDSAPVPAAPSTASAAPAAPDYGRWTVAPGAWPEAGHGKIVMSVCDPANLANLPASARRACAETLRTAAGPPARRDAAPDWKTRNPLSCDPKNEPAHKWIVDHCRGLGLGMKYRF